MSEGERTAEAVDAAAKAVAAIQAADVASPVDAARAVNAVASGATPTGRGRRAGFAGAAIGLVAAGVAVERLTVHRTVRRKARLALDAAGPYGSLRGTPGTARAEDGTELYFETDEADAFAGPAGASAAAAGDGTGGPTVGPIRLGTEAGPVPEGAPGTGTAESVRAEPVRAASPPQDSGDPAPQRSLLLRLLRRHAQRRAAPAAEEAPPEPGPGTEPEPTVVFSHGYCLNMDVWHFQRAALRGVLRAVYWDQRSHGRSGRAPVGEPVTIDRLGRDLKAVLDEAVPEGPIVLVGHSMGGMTVMALADQYPEFVAERVVGAAFIGTSAGGLGEATYGLPLPAVGVKAVRRLVPGVLKALVAQTELVEKGRRAAADLFAGLVKRYSFGSGPEVDPGVARFAERLIESVPIDVVAEFYPAFEAHEKTAALAAFDGRPALVLAGDRDLLTPHSHSEAIAAALPAAELVILERTGHLAMLERPGTVNERIAGLLTRTIRGHGHGSTTAHRTDRPTHHRA